MPSPETQRVRTVEHFIEVDGVGIAVTRENGKLWLSVSGSKEYIAEITQDRQHILEVLKEGVRETELKMNVNEYLENVKEACGNYDLAFDQGYTQAKKDILTLLQETLGEGKEINSIFKE